MPLTISETKGDFNWLKKLGVRRKKGEPENRSKKGRVACVCKVVPKGGEE